jgi:hypothetical protein
MSLDKETKGIKAALVFDILGRPPEYLAEMLEKIINELDKEKGVRVDSRKIHPPVLMKEQKDFYTTFAEVEIEVEQISILAAIMFKYMPAHVEVIHPELIALSNGGWSDILSELTTKLHAYEEVTRMAQTEKTILENKLRELLGQKTEGDESKAKTKAVKKISKKTKKK